jgi:hypothetical protein
MDEVFTLNDKREWVSLKLKDLSQKCKEQDQINKILITAASTDWRTVCELFQYSKMPR